MAAWGARYARVGDRFEVSTISSPNLEPDDLTDLSRERGEAIAIQVHAIADVVVYDHFVAGSLKRGLTHAGEAGWIRVAGDPEPWEAAAFFASSTLDDLREELENDLEGDDLAREIAELQALFAARTLCEGSARPPARPAAVVRAIERHFGLPARGVERS